MRRFAGMRRAGERQFAVAEAVGIGRTAFHQRQRLDRLHGGARENRPLDLAQDQHGRAVAVADDRRAAVRAFHAASAQHFDQDFIHEKFA